MKQSLACARLTTEIGEDNTRQEPAARRGEVDRSEARVEVNQVLPLAGYCVEGGAT